MWKKAPAGLIETFEAVRPGPPAVHKYMFGYPCCFVNGNMFMGLHEDHMVLRLGDDERARLLAMEGAQPFEPMPGRPMKEYVVLPAALLADRTALREWVGTAMAHAAALPPKGKVATGKAAAKIRPSTPPPIAAPRTPPARKKAATKKAAAKKPTARKIAARKATPKS
jgi:TfoX/Sxy family transcriptional regulator of competence genes